MSAVDELITWLRACLDTEERLAQRVADRYHVRNPDREDHGQPLWPLPSVEACFHGRTDPDISAGLDLIKAFNPKRVLAEIEAKRRILAHIGMVVISPGREAMATEYVEQMELFLRVLAQPYAGRDGWREEWAA